MFKVKNGLSPEPVCELFKNTNNCYPLRNKKYWEVPKMRTMTFGTETIRYRGIKTWDMVPDDIKNSKSLREFKSKIKHWTPVGCTCRLCQTFVPELGYI